MGSRIGPKTRFIALTVGIAVGLYIIWPGVSAAYRVFVSWAGSALRYAAGTDTIELLGEKDSYALIPVIAVIAAAQGHPPRRKVSYILVAIGLFLFVGTLTIAFDLVSASPDGDARNAGDLVFALLDVAIPVAVLVFFTGREPSLLWSKGPEQHRVEGRCPLCDKKQSDLKTHVLNVHGRSALDDPKVRRRLAAGGG